MAIKPRKLTEEEKSKRDKLNKELADEFRGRGMPHTADYVEMFGPNFSPWFYHLTPVEVKERFYKKCVDAKLPWNAFQDELPDDVIL